MKTAISLPDDIFQAADELAQKLGVSRGQLYAMAVSDYVERHRESNVAERLNAVYSEVEARLDPGLSDLQFYSAGKVDKW